MICRKILTSACTTTLFLMLSSALPCSVSAQSYTVQPLAPVPGESTYHFASDIDNNGRVVGSFNTNWTSKAALWKSPGSGMQLPSVSGTTPNSLSEASAISPNGKFIVGINETDPAGDYDTGVVWINQVPQLLPAYPACNQPGVVAHGANDLGMFIGNDRCGHDALLWAFNNIVPLPGAASFAASIARNGVVGTTSVNGIQRAFLYTFANNNMTILPAVRRGFWAQGASLNDSNVLVGLAQTGVSPNGDPEFDPIAGFRWANGNMTLIPPLPGYTNSYLFDINSAGVSVGYSYGEGRFKGILVNPNQSTPIDLNGLIAPGQGYVSYAKAINDRGMILVSMSDNIDGNPGHFAVLVPVPTP